MIHHMRLLRSRYDIQRLKYGIMISFGHHRWIIRPFQAW